MPTKPASRPDPGPFRYARPLYTDYSDYKDSAGYKDTSGPFSVRFLRFIKNGFYLEIIDFPAVGLVIGGISHFFGDRGILTVSPIKPLTANDDDNSGFVLNPCGF